MPGNIGNKTTGGPRYMRSFYLPIRLSAIANWPFFWKVTPNLQSFLVFFKCKFLYMRANFFGPYLLYIMRSTCISNFSIVFPTKFAFFKDDISFKWLPLVDVFFSQAGNELGTSKEQALYCPYTSCLVVNELVPSWLKIEFLYSFS